MAVLARAQPRHPVAQPQFHMPVSAQVFRPRVDGDRDRRDLRQEPVAGPDPPAHQGNARPFIDALAHADPDQRRIRLQDGQHGLPPARLVRHIAHHHAAGVDDAEHLHERRLDQTGIERCPIIRRTGHVALLVQPLQHRHRIADCLFRAQDIALGNRLHLRLRLCYGVGVEHVIGRDQGSDRQNEGDHQSLEKAGITVRHAAIRHLMECQYPQLS